MPDNSALGKELDTPKWCSADKMDLLQTRAFCYRQASARRASVRRLEEKMKIIPIANPASRSVRGTKKRRRPSSDWTSTRHSFSVKENPLFPRSTGLLPHSMRQAQSGLRASSQFGNGSKMRHRPIVVEHWLDTALQKKRDKTEKERDRQTEVSNLLSDPRRRGGRDKVITHGL